MAYFSKVPSLYRHKSLSKAKIQRIFVQLLTPYPSYFVLLSESCIAFLTKQLSGPGNIISKTFEYGPQRRIPSNQLFLFLISRNGDSSREHFNLYSVFSLTWPAPMQIYWNKRKHLHKKRVQLPQDWIGTLTWPPFHCFGTQIWSPRRHVKTHN